MQRSGPRTRNIRDGMFDKRRFNLLSIDKAMSADRKRDRTWPCNSNTQYTGVSRILALGNSVANCIRLPRNYAVVRQRGYYQPAGIIFSTKGRLKLTLLSRNLFANASARYRLKIHNCYTFVLFQGILKGITTLLQTKSILRFLSIFKFLFEYKCR